MIRVAWKGLAARPVRTALTTLAIVVGVAFVCAAYTLTDTMRGAADSLSRAAYDGSTSSDTWPSPTTASRIDRPVMGSGVGTGVLSIALSPRQP